MDHVPFTEAVRVWWRVGLQSFGGPAAQIATMHRILVEEKRWIGDARFLHALNFCMLIPGPEAQQLAVYVGWLLNGRKGGIAAGALFVLPGLALMLVIAAMYATWHEVPAIEALLYGLKAATIAIVAEAVVRIGKRVAGRAHFRALSAVAFLALFVGDIPFPLVIAAAGAFGFLGGRLAPEHFAPTQGAGKAQAVRGLLDDALDRATPAAPSASATALVVGGWSAAWLAPVAALRIALGPDDVFARIASFFATAAAVTFGGAYAVLALVAQRAVDDLHWLTAPQMLDALGLAETTPGPLVLVNVFVAFLAAAGQPGAMHPLVAGTLGGLLCAWVTFAPSWLWIFAAAPYVEALRANKALASALAAIGAAVLGVVAQLGAFLALHVLFGTVHTARTPIGGRLLVPELATFDPISALIAIGAAIALLRYHFGIPSVLAGGAVAGALARLALGG